MPSEILVMEKSKINKILANKKLLESKLNVKINIVKNQAELEGDEVDIFTAKKVVGALERNFPIAVSLLLIDAEYLLEDIPIKDVTRKTNLEIVRARIIGTEGRTIQTLETLSDCHLTLHDNTVSVIGTFDKMKDMIHAVKGLIAGSKQANVYKYLEKTRTRIRHEELALKKE